MSERPLKAVLYVEGGVVHDVDMPAGVEVHVKDYDVEGVESADLETDDDGNTFYRRVFQGAEHLDVTLPVPVMPNSDEDEGPRGVTQLRFSHDPHGVSLDLPTADDSWQVVIEKRSDGWKLFVFDEGSSAYVCLRLGTVGTHVDVMDSQDRIVAQFAPDV